jgi:hypothetical protein
MNLVRLFKSDGSWDNFESDWKDQCENVGDDFCSYASASLGVLSKFANDGQSDEWAVAIFGDDQKILAVACAIRATQKGYVGKVLRIREVTVCPLLDYGKLPESDYIDTLIGLLNEAVKLSESGLRAKHIKIHLRSPADSMFFRAVGKSLDGKGVFAETEAHGAWLSFTKH